MDETLDIATNVDSLILMKGGAWKNAGQSRVAEGSLV